MVRVHPVSFGKSGMVVFTRVRAGCRRVHSGSLDSLGCTLVVVGFIWGRRVHLCPRWGSFGSSGVVEFTRVRAEGRWVHPGSLGSFLWVVWFIRDRWIHSGPPLGAMASSGAVGFT